MKVKNEKDLWAGLMFIGAGLFFVVVAQMNYQIGVAARMGPGYFPSVLGGLLGILGGAVLAGAFVGKQSKLPAFRFRPIICILSGCLAFAYLLEPIGFVGAGALLIFISAYGGLGFKWKEVAGLTVILLFFSVLVFVKGLTLPFSVWPAFLQ